MKGIWILGAVALLLLAACVTEQRAVPFADEPGANSTNATIAPIGAPAANATQPAQQPAQQPAPPASPQQANTTNTAAATTTTAASSNTTQTTTAQTNTSSANTTQTNVSSIPSCLDTDGGDFKNVKGTVQLVAGSKQYLKTDFCVSKTLIEWYCDLSELKQKEYECANGCDDGACIQ